MVDNKDKSKGNKLLGVLGYILVVFLLSLLAVAILAGSGFKHSRQYAGEESTAHSSVSTAYTE
ncbi:MAG TPA: hypothetical protein PKW24_07190 [Clostridiales bacterium]|jgi:hypothetical protein|nr:hypothetical protein [Clostridiales bacterium]